VVVEDEAAVAAVVVVEDGIMVVTWVVVEAVTETLSVLPTEEIKKFWEGGVTLDDRIENGFERGCT
jgi:hypothetical protein